MKLLDDLESEIAVHDVMVAYMAACDLHDADAVADLFHEDGVWKSRLQPDEPIIGREAIRATFREACARLSFCVHYLTNESIVVDGSKAHARWRYFEPAINRGDLAVWTAGRYWHEFTRRDGLWRFQNFEIEPVLASPYESGWAVAPKVALD